MRKTTLLLLACLFGCAGAQRKPAPAAAPHPLDPLSADEIRAAVAALKDRMTETMRFPMIALKEPPKSWTDASSPREAAVVAFDRAANKTFEGVVDLKQGKISSWNELPGVQPAVMFEEYDVLPGLVRADARWQEAMRKRNISDFENVQIDAWAAGGPDAQGRRLLRALSYYRGKNRNAYGRPIEGVVALVDMNRRQVVEVRDQGVTLVAEASQDFDPPSIGALRPAPAALRTLQPGGPGFRVSGQEVRWENWSFRFGLHPREGLVLHRVAYADRPILYRASLSEMVVPYADPSESWTWRNAFDQGEYGMGRSANTLNAGEDAPENAVFFDATFADDLGAPYVQERAVMLFERDGGLLWKHFDWDSKHTETRRARDLVIGYLVTIGNYDYGFNWIFRQDGTMELEAVLSGILLPKGVKTGACESCPSLSAGRNPRQADERYGHLVAKNVLAPNHQHFFNFRLDFDVEGSANTAVEMNTRAARSPAGNAFVMEETVLQRERGARRDLNPQHHRRWRVLNPKAKNDLGHLAGFTLVPGENGEPYLTSESPVRRRGGFIDHPVWFTRYKEGEMNAAGPYPNQGPPGKGLPQWTADDEPIVGTDLVLWYTFAVTHVPRAEDWPVMPAARAGFKLVPDGFFTRNPALDVPPSR
jgi:primary-amine oxidase